MLELKSFYPLREEIPTTGKQATPTTMSVEDIVDNPDSKALDMWDVDDEVKMLRTSNNPLDTLIRYISDSLPADSQRVKFWSAKQNESLYKVAEEATAPEKGTFTITLTAVADDLGTDDILSFKDVAIKGRSYEPANGSYSTENDVPLALQVVDKTTVLLNKNNVTQITVIALNNDGNANAITIPAGAEMFGRGNAKNEEDVLSYEYHLRPQETYNFCQRYMKVISESKFQNKVKKEAKWSLQELKGAAAFAFRREIELTSFVGVRSIIKDSPTGTGEKYTAGGIEDFAKGRILDSVDTALNPLTFSSLQNWGKQLFASCNGSDERYAFASPNVMGRILAMFDEKNYGDNTILRVCDAVDLNNEKIGFSIKKIDTGYGYINLVLHRALADRRDKRLYFVDLDNIRRRVHTPAKITQYDLSKILRKNANAMILEECSCLEFLNPETMGYVDFK